MRLIHASSRPSAALRRRGVAALVVAIVLVLPGIALANHQFADVPTSYTFHDDIEQLYGARIGTGCGGGNYCPNNPVTRGQMAGFLNRGLGRIGSNFLNGSLEDTTAQAIGQVTVVPSNPSGGHMFVQIQAWADVYTGATGCPCEVILWIDGETNGGLSGDAYADLPAIPAGDNDSDEAVSLFAVDVAATGVAETYTVWAQVLMGTADVNVYGTVSATVIPFDGSGNAAEPFIMLNGESAGK
jgi:hypothetical protein